MSSLLVAFKAVRGLPLREGLDGRGEGPQHDAPADRHIQGVQVSSPGLISLTSFSI